MTETSASEPVSRAEMDRQVKRAQRLGHARGMMQGIASMLRPGDVVVDLGANLGVVSSQLAASGAQLHAFEPDPWAYERLSARLGAMANVSLHNAAAGTKAGTARLMRAPGFDENPRHASIASTLLPGGKNTDEDAGFDVALVDMPAFLADLVAQHGRIAFLKIDIEGAELDLLEEMEKTDLFDHITLTVVEMHGFRFPELRPRFDALHQRITTRYPITQVNLDWI